MSSRTRRRRGGICGGGSFSLNCGMRYSFLLLIAFFGCGDRGQDIRDEQAEIKIQIDHINRTDDSLTTVLEHSSDMRTEELVKIQLQRKKLQEEKAFLVVSLDSLQKQIDK